MHRDARWHALVAQNAFSVQEGTLEPQIRGGSEGRSLGRKDQVVPRAPAGAPSKRSAVHASKCIGALASAQE
jgi:hypothetical protein